MFEQINEPVRVLSVCEAPAKGLDGKLTPLQFFWQNREFQVKTINLAYSVREGRSKIYYFAVSDSANYFKLKFDPEALKWTLIETYVE